MERAIIKWIFAPFGCAEPSDEQVRKVLSSLTNLTSRSYLHHLSSPIPIIFIIFLVYPPLFHSALIITHCIPSPEPTKRASFALNQSHISCKSGSTVIVAKKAAPQTMHFLVARFKQEEQNLCEHERTTGSTMMQERLDCLRGNLQVLVQVGHQQKMLGG